MAFRDNKKRFDHAGDTFTFKNTKTTLYRVWCREVLQKHYSALAIDDKNRVDELFAPYGGLSNLLTDGVIESKIEDSFKLPIDPDTREFYKTSVITSLLGQPRN